MCTVLYVALCFGSAKNGPANGIDEGANRPDAAKYHKGPNRKAILYTVLAHWGGGVIATMHCPHKTL